MTTGRRPTVQITRRRRARRMAIMVVIVVLLLGIRPQGRAELLMSETCTFVDHPPF